MKLMVLNLPRDFTKQDIAEMFKVYGNIRGCDLILDEETGKSKGFAFVEMALDHEGDIAIDALHGSQQGRNKIRVKMADER
jgi:RNA recognition motif-containing protein|tara:strand:- start:307 stop:549 length:243 start_codon:yes stop_codon:yes gene_type:complete